MEQNFFDIDPRLEKLGEQAQLDCAQAFARTEEIGEYNSRKVLEAFLHNGVSESHFAGSTGYGYDDRGRETLEAVMAEITGSEDALMRHNFVSGPHTLTPARFGVLRPGDGVCTALPRLFPAALHQHGHDGKADSDGAEKQSQGDFHGG